MRAPLGWTAIAALAVLAGCGTRTALLVDSQDGGVGFGDDAGVPGTGDDSGIDSTGDASPGRTGDGGGGSHGCGDTVSSPRNCGVCGHDCQAGACAKGVCQPFLLTDGEFFPNTLAVDSSNVYWANLTDVDYGMPPRSIVMRRMDKNGGAPTTLDTIVPGWPTSLHADGRYLYLYRSIAYTVAREGYDGSLVRMCTDGACARTSLAGPIENEPWQIAMDATRIFFPNRPTGGLAQIPKGGGAPVPLAYLPGFDFARLALDDDYVYAIALPNDTLIATEPVRFVRALKDPGSTLTTLMRGLIEGADVVVDANDIFVSDTKRVYRLPKTGAGALQPIAITPQGKAGFLAMDAQRIYWLEYDERPSLPILPSLHWVRKDGTGLGSMILAQSATRGPGLVVDDKALYWVATLASLQPPTPPRGGIVKVVKPL